MKESEIMSFGSLQNKSLGAQVHAASVPSYARGGKVRANHYAGGGSALSADQSNQCCVCCSCNPCCSYSGPIGRYGLGGTIGGAAGAASGIPFGGAIGSAIGCLICCIFGCCCCCGPAPAPAPSIPTPTALCGQASELVGHSGNFSPDTLAPLTQMNMGANVGANPDLGMYQGEMMAGGGRAGGASTGCWLKDFEGALKCATPEWACLKCNMLRSEMHTPNSTMHPLHQIRCSIVGNAEGGLAHYKAAAPKGHHPEFITGLTGYYACGGGTGQSDDIPAMLHDGDYVMDAETVSSLGDGSSKAGMHVLEGFRKQLPHKDGPGVNPVPAKIADGEYVFPASFVSALGGGDNRKGSDILDGLREKLREHKRKTPLDSIPPKAKTPIDYINKGKK